MGLSRPRRTTIALRLCFSARCILRVCSFTFQFHSVQQIQACLDYYDRKIQPSSRLDIGAADHWECERWFERLPLFLREESKRQRVVKALRDALKKFGGRHDRDG